MRNSAANLNLLLHPAQDCPSIGLEHGRECALPTGGARCTQPPARGTEGWQFAGRLGLSRCCVRRAAAYYGLASVLVVDDRSAMRKLIADMALSEGHTVRTATDGREAFQACLTTNYDLVITDLHMPAMGGDELIRELRAVGHRAKICMFSAAIVDRHRNH